MSQLALAAEVRELGDREVLWQSTTGRALPLTDALRDALGSPPPPLRARLEALGMLGERDPVSWVVVRSHWAMRIDDALWHALPLQRGPGGFPFGAMPMEPADRALWTAINGARRIGALAERVGLSTGEVLTRLARWTAIEVQAVQLRPDPPRPRDPGLARLVAPQRPSHARAPHHYDGYGATTLDRYHTEQITDGRTHFDDRETTLAHAFARPHPAFGGRPYGAALARSLGPVDGPVLEVGPGTGELCAAFRTARPDPDYLRLDLSPELLRTQEARCPGTRSLLGSATAIPLPDRSVGTVISNEVLADLEAGPSPGDWPVAAEPGQQRFNTGAFAMLAEVARVLKPGGQAWLSEFGALHELPTETTHLDHPEVSIHFGQLAAVARHLGLQAEVLSLADALGADRTARWLARPSYEALRARFAAEGKHLEARAWTPDSLDLPWEVDGLHTVPITEPGAAPVIDRILVLVARKAE